MSQRCDHDADRPEHMKRALVTSAIEKSTSSKTEDRIGEVRAAQAHAARGRVAQVGAFEDRARELEVQPRPGEGGS